MCQSENRGSAGSANSCADRYLIGPTVHIPVVGGLAVDVAALYSRVQLEGGARSTTGPSFSTQRSGSSWEVPILAKYRFNPGRIAPFVGAGPTFRRISMEGENTIINVAGQPLTAVASVSQTEWQSGVVLGGGVEFRTSFVRFSPEVRYSRFGSPDPCAECGPYTLPLARSSATVLLLGITF